MADAREIAEQLIASSARDVPYGNLRAAVLELNLPRREGDDLRNEVADLIDTAVVTVTFPGSPGRRFASGEPYHFGGTGAIEVTPELGEAADA